MGLFWSKATNEPDDYEKILSNLTARISHIESNLVKTRSRQRQLTVNLLTYSSLFYLAVLLYIFLYPRRPPTISYRPLLDTFTVLGIPFFIWSSRRVISWYFQKRILRLEGRLKSYRAEQKTKVEELKKVTAYYRTKGLIEKFDLDETDESGKPLEKDKDQTPPLNMGEPENVVLENRVSPPQVPLNGPPISDSPSFVPSLIPHPPPTPYTWMDKIVDAIIGDDRTNRYALICQKCHAHNGLARPEDLQTLQYFCPRCLFLNLPKVNPANGDENGSENNSPLNTDINDVSEAVMETPKQITKNESKVRKRKSHRLAAAAKDNDKDKGRDRDMSRSSDNLSKINTFESD